MSLSPPVWRYPHPSTSTSKREEDLINAYEAEEEKIINVLSRKLEKVCIIRPDLPYQPHLSYTERAHHLLSPASRRED